MRVRCAGRLESDGVNVANKEPRKKSKVVAKAKVGLIGSR